MKNFIVLTVFISTMIFGLAVTESFDLSGKFKSPCIVTAFNGKAK